MLDGKRSSQVLCSLGYDYNTIGCCTFLSFIFVLVDSYFSHFEEEIELQLAMGNLDIESLQRIDDFHPDKSTTKVQMHQKY